MYMSIQLFIGFACYIVYHLVISFYSAQQCCTQNINRKNVIIYQKFLKIIYNYYILEVS